MARLVVSQSFGIRCKKCNQFSELRRIEKAGVALRRTREQLDK